MAALLCAACDAAAPCLTMGTPELVARAKRFRLDVYGDTASCDGNHAAAGSGAPRSTFFDHGDTLQLDIPPGRHTLGAGGARGRGGDRGHGQRLRHHRSLRRR